MSKLEIARKRLYKGFQELLHIELEIKYAFKDEEYLTVQEVYENEFCIEVDFSLRCAPLEALVGGMGHEFGHVALDLRKSPKKRDEALRKYYCSERYRKFDERRADKLMIERGFGKYLLAFKKFAENRGEESELCLSLYEINKLLRKAG